MVLDNMVSLAQPLPEYEILLSIPGIADFFEYQKSPIRLIMKSDQTIIRKYLMEQINNTTELIGIKDNNITIQKALDGGSHREIYAKLDYTPPLCPHCPRDND